MTTTSLTPRFTRQSARGPALGHGTIAIAVAALTESGFGDPDAYRFGKSGKADRRPDRCTPATE